MQFLKYMMDQKQNFKKQRAQKLHVFSAAVPLGPHGQVTSLSQGLRLVPCESEGTKRCSAGVGAPRMGLSDSRSPPRGSGFFSCSRARSAWSQKHESRLQQQQLFDFGFIIINQANNEKENEHCDHVLQQRGQTLMFIFVSMRVPRLIFAILVLTASLGPCRVRFDYLFCFCMRHCCDQGRDISGKYLCQDQF